MLAVWSDGCATRIAHPRFLLNPRNWPVVSNCPITGELFFRNSRTHSTVIRILIHGLQIVLTTGTSQNALIRFESRLFETSEGSRCCAVLSAYKAPILAETTGAKMKAIFNNLGNQNPVMFKLSLPFRQFFIVEVSLR